MAMSYHAVLGRRLLGFLVENRSGGFQPSRSIRFGCRQTALSLTPTRVEWREAAHSRLLIQDGSTVAKDVVMFCGLGRGLIKGKHYELN